MKKYNPDESISITNFSIVNKRGVFAFCNVGFKEINIIIGFKYVTKCVTILVGTCSILSSVIDIVCYTSTNYTILVMQNQIN